MNKATKGAIAAGAAGILLAGGAGTFALWTDSDTVNAGTVSTGALSMTVGDGMWTETATPAVEIIDIANFEIVPGDSLTYTTAITVVAEGENLQAELTVPTSLVATITADGGAPAAEQNLAIDMDIDSTQVAGIVVDGNTVSFDQAQSYTIPVTVTVDFTDVAVNVDQKLNVDLSQALTFTLNQV